MRIHNEGLFIPVMNKDYYKYATPLYRLFKEPLQSRYIGGT
jgi:hypothetical protein